MGSLKTNLHFVYSESIFGLIVWADIASMLSALLVKLKRDKT